MAFARNRDWLRVICNVHAIRCYTPSDHGVVVGTSIMGFAVVLKEINVVEPSRIPIAWYTSCYVYDAIAFAATRSYVEIEDTSGV